MYSTSILQISRKTHHNYIFVVRIFQELYAHFAKILQNYIDYYKEALIMNPYNTKQGALVYDEEQDRLSGREY